MDDSRPVPPLQPQALEQLPTVLEHLRTMWAALATLAPTAVFCTILHPKKRAVLLAYGDCGQIKRACEAANTPFSLHYYWLKQDPAFTGAMRAASPDSSTRLAL